MTTRSRATRLLAVASAAAAALALGPALAAPAQAKPAHLDPAALARGADPQIPYLLGNTLHDGDRTVRVAKAPNHIALYETRRGYVVVDNLPRAKRTFRITSISDSGRRKVIARPEASYTTALSPFGNRLAWSDRISDLSGRSIVKVVDPHTGRRVARRAFRNADVLAVTANRVLITRTLPGGNEAVTLWWNYRRDRVRQVAPQQGLHADVRNDVLALSRPFAGACARVVRLSRPERQLYRNCRIDPHTWSPNGRHAMATNIYFDAPGTDRWVVTDARTGEPRARVTGRLDWDVAWEDNRHFLTMAQSDQGKAAVIRCDLQARCERAGRLWDRAVNEDEYFVGPPVLLASN
jgi:hypothetical protein